MNLFEEHKDDLPHQHPPCLSVMIQKQRHMDDMEIDSDEECFDLGGLDDISNSDMDVNGDTDSLKVAKTTQVCVLYLGWVDIHNSCAVSHLGVKSESKVQLVRSLRRRQTSCTVMPNTL
jgi:hypothetical protein